MDNTRHAKPGDAIEPEFTGKAVIDKLMSMESFEDFGSYKDVVQRGGDQGGTGLLEGTPHNYVHRFVNGNMVTLLSPRDPLFWTHHANVDRLWANWNEYGKRNPIDGTFVKYVFQKNFYSSNGVAEDITCGTVLDHKAMGYKYDVEGQPPTLEELHNSAFTFDYNSIRNSLNSINSVALQPVSAHIPNGVGFTNEIANIAKNNSREKGIKLIISHIIPPADENFFVRIFINFPRALSKEISITDPHYAGSFSFFGSSHHHGGMTAMSPETLTFIFDITQTLRNINTSADGKVSFGDLSIQFLPIPIDKTSKAKFVAEKISVIIANRD